MAVCSQNHTNFGSRIHYIQQLLSYRLGFSSEHIKQTEITPIQYDPDCPFKYNNFVYRLTLPSDINHLLDLDDSHPHPHHETQIKTSQPGSVPIPSDTKQLIVRLSNPDAEDMHAETRVQNEVAMLSLASRALSHIKPNVVPRVFAWGAATHNHLGWIVQEFMPGEPLAEPFDETMSLDQKKAILAQMATLLKALQDFPLPNTIQGWGGVTFAENGAIVSAPMTTVGAGPWSSLEDSFKARIKEALVRADKNPYLQGWRANGVRDRINAFIEHGLPEQFSHLASKLDRAIVHADFTPDNLLYSPTTGCITALLDYDFSGILHPAYEFLRSFGPNGGQLSGWSANPEATAIRNAKLTGQFPSPLPAPVASVNGPGVDWELALAWEAELQRLQVKRPSTILGIEGLADVDGVLGSLLPWQLTSEDFLKMNQDEGQRVALRRTSEEQLVGLLEHLGF